MNNQVRTCGCPIPAVVCNCTVTRLCDCVNGLNESVFEPGVHSTPNRINTSPQSSSLHHGNQSFPQPHVNQSLYNSHGNQSMSQSNRRPAVPNLNNTYVVAQTSQGTMIFTVSDHDTNTSAEDSSDSSDPFHNSGTIYTVGAITNGTYTIISRTAPNSALVNWTYSVYSNATGSRVASPVIIASAANGTYTITPAAASSGTSANVTLSDGEYSIVPIEAAPKHTKYKFKGLGREKYTIVGADSSPANASKNFVSGTYILSSDDIESDNYIYTFTTNQNGTYSISPDVEDGNLDKTNSPDIISGNYTFTGVNDEGIFRHYAVSINEDGTCTVRATGTSTSTPAASGPDPSGGDALPSGSYRIYSQSNLLGEFLIKSNNDGTYTIGLGTLNSNEVTLISGIYEVVPVTEPGAANSITNRSTNTESSRIYPYIPSHIDSEDDSRTLYYVSITDTSGLFDFFYCDPRGSPQRIVNGRYRLFETDNAGHAYPARRQNGIITVHEACNNARSADKSMAPLASSTMYSERSTPGQNNKSAARSLPHRQDCMHACCKCLNERSNAFMPSQDQTIPSRGEHNPPGTASYAGSYAPINFSPRSPYNSEPVYIPDDASFQVIPQSVSPMYQHCSPVNVSQGPMPNQLTFNSVPANPSVNTPGSASMHTYRTTSNARSCPPGTNVTPSVTTRIIRHVQTIRPNQLVPLPETGVSVVRNDSNEDIEIVVETETEEDVVIQTVASAAVSVNIDEGNERTSGGSDEGISDDIDDEIDRFVNRIQNIEDSIREESSRQRLLTARLSENEHVLTALQHHIVLLDQTIRMLTTHHQARRAQIAVPVSVPRANMAGAAATAEPSSFGNRRQEVLYRNPRFCAGSRQSIPIPMPSSARENPQTQSDTSNQSQNYYGLQ